MLAAANPEIATINFTDSSASWLWLKKKIKKLSEEKHKMHLLHKIEINLKNYICPCLTKINKANCPLHPWKNIISTDNIFGSIGPMTETLSLMLHSLGSPQQLLSLWSLEPCTAPHIHKHYNITMCHALLSFL